MCEGADFEEHEVEDFDEIDEEDIDSEESDSEDDDEMEESSDFEENKNKKIKKYETRYMVKYDKAYAADDNTTIIPNIYEYMIKNYNKVIYWIESLSKTPTCQYRYKCLDDGVHSEEDFIQSAYTKILKTFYDNEQRYKVCSACTHQCKEFTEKTKKTNTEKFAKGYDCRPYMYYQYTEKDFHNYINCSLKQNINLKLENYSKPVEKTTVRLDAPIGDDESETNMNFIFESRKRSADLVEFLDKKLLFSYNLGTLDLLPDPFDKKSEVLVVPNEEYNEAYEHQKMEKRKVYSKYGLPIPEDLKPVRKEEVIHLGVPVADMYKELWNRFDLFKSESIRIYEEDRKRIEEENRKIDEENKKIEEENKNLKEKKELLPKLEVPKIEDIPLDQVITDEEIIDGLKNLHEKVEGIEILDLSESEEMILEAKEWAELDMMECLPDLQSLVPFNLKASEKDAISDFKCGFDSIKDYIEYDQSIDERFLLPYNKNQATTEDVLAFAEKIANFDFEPVYSYYEYEHSVDEHSLDLKMIYDPKKTEVRLIGKDCNYIPLPLTLYAEVSLRDFLDMAKDMKSGEEWENYLFDKSSYLGSLKEFWVDFSGKRYNIVKSIERDLSLESRKSMTRAKAKALRILKMMERFSSRFDFNVEKDVLENIEQPTVFSAAFMKKINKFVKEEAEKLGHSRHVNTVRMLAPVPRKVKLTEEERHKLAQEQLELELSLNRKVNRKKKNAKEEDLQNLNQQKLFDKILSKTPVQRIEYRMEEVDVLCTSHTRSRIEV